jgi:hypothetical protein
MNKVSLIYPKNKLWRPTYYLFSSTNVNSPIWGQSWIDAVREAASEERTIPFIATQFKEAIDPNNTIPRINWFSSMSENKPSPEGDVLESCFSTDIVKRIDKSGTTMNLALQLAYHMNFSEIIFLGADLGWTKDLGSESDPNHFDKSYRANISNPQKANYQMRNIHSLAFSKLKQRNKNTKLYNASLKTCLDIYPIINYEKYILENEIVPLQDKIEAAKEFWEKPPQYSGLIEK